MNQENGDFDDVPEAHALGGLGGILESGGLRDYDGIKETVEQDGVIVRMNCRYCNHPGRVTLKWPEVIQVGANAQGAVPVLPQGWQVSRANRTAFVSLPCKCGQLGFNVHLSPEDARRHVQEGGAAGVVNPQEIQQIQHRVAVAQGRAR